MSQIDNQEFKIKPIEVDMEDENTLIMPSGKLASVSRKINEIKVLLETQPPVEQQQVLDHYTMFGQRYEALDNACKEELSKSLCGTDHLKLVSWQNKYEEEIITFQKQVQAWIKIHSPKPQQKSKPEGSVDAKSVKTEASAVLLANLADQRAKREAEERYQTELKELQQRMDELKVKKELYYEQNLEKEINAIEDNKSVSSRNSNNISVDHFNTFLVQQKKLVEIMAKSHQKVQLPCNEPPTFDGNDITLFKPFMLSFYTNITERCDNEYDKLQYLEKYTSGAPRDLVRSCFGQDNGFALAVSLLKKRYDNEFKIADCYLQKIENFPIIKNDDCKAFEKFAIFLTSCLNVMNNIDSLNQLNSPKDMMTIVKKLPYKYREKWRLHAYDLNKNNNRIHFEHLVNFVNEQANIVNFPIFNDLKDRDNVPQNRPKNLFVSTNQSEVTNDKEPNQYKQVNNFCLCCKKNNHVLEKCFFFSRMLHDNKLRLIRENKLCFSCLKPGHRSAGCLHRSTCDTCHRKHPTVLHNNEFKPRGNNNEVRTFSIMNKNNSKTPNKLAHAVVPIKIRAKGKKHYIYTYMAMDNFSSDCFINEKMMKVLGLDGNKTDIYLTTFEGNSVKRPTYAIHDLEITDLDENEYSLIPTTYSCVNWPFDKADCPQEKDVINLPYLNDIPFRYIDAEIGILVGANMPSLLKPLKVVGKGDNDPFAVLHKFGWSLNGPLKQEDGKSKIYCHRIKLDLNEKINSFFSQDFVDNHQDEIGLSMDDRHWKRIMEESCKLKNDGHYEIKLPFKEEPNFADNRLQVINRLQSGRRRLINNPQFHEEYTAFMEDMLSKGFAEKVPKDELVVDKGKVWYLVHHGVYHPVKGKIRVVFDCSLKYNNVCLNDKLLQGIDLTNNLLDVLIRFRQHKIGILGDIAKMFYQVHIPVEDRNYLRYFWYPNGDLNKTPEEYRITVHVFEAKSSPSCANFALKNTVYINPDFYSFESQISVLEDFYVDDWVKSVDSVCEGTLLIDEIGKIVSQAGFNLTSFSSNSKELLAAIPHDKLSEKIKKVNLFNEDLPYDRALGVFWNTENDCLGFNINFVKNNCTKRGVLSTTFSVVSPVIIPAKRIFQIACSKKLDWDTELPSDLANKWNTWFDNISELSNFKISRCYSNCHAISINNIQLHIFCDGSETAYAATAYLRIESTTGTHCSLVLSKSRLTPVSSNTLKTTPRIELTAAHLAIKLKCILLNALTLNINDTFFWTDSLTVLKYISNDTARFQHFVSNKIAFIRSHSVPDQWRYVPSAINIADVASRGMNVTDFLNCKQWINGPDFLYLNSEHWPNYPIINSNCEDLEIKASTFCTTYIDKKLIKPNPIDILLTSCSSWYKLKTRVSWILKVKFCLKNKCKSSRELTVKDLKLAEEAIFSYIQYSCFHNEITILKSNKSLPKNSSLLKLYPFIDNIGLIRVGGRLDRSSETFEFKHPIVLPNNCFVTELLIRDIHVKVGHLGRRTILSELRQNYWVIGASKMIDRVTRNCIFCRKQHSKPSVQIMGNLPIERFKCNEKPFSYIGIDCFGPFFVTRGRKTEKRYGIIFTCLSSRAIHLEVCCSLDTESFLCAFSRFTSRRGNVITIRSDNGGNFVSGNKVLNSCISEWNKTSHSWMLQRNIKWIFQPPLSSHFGGIWEREIRSIRKVLNGLLSEQNIRLTDERLNTLMCEIESVLNSRPLTELSSDVCDLEPLTPNHLLLCYSAVSFPPGLFNEHDLYAKNRWRQVQYLTNLFWCRWRKEYLPLLQQRQKWFVKVEPHKVGDLVLVTDQFLPRNQWSTGRIIEVAKDEYNNVRSAKVRVAKAIINKNKIVCETKVLERPIVKLILLRGNDDI